MVTPMLLDLSSDSKYEGYRYEKGQTPAAINGSGSTVFRIYYDVRKPVSLTVNKIKVIIDGDSLLKKDIVDDNVSIELANYLTLTMPTSGMTMTGIRYILTYRTCDNDDLISASGRQKIQSEDTR